MNCTIAYVLLVPTVESAETIVATEIISGVKFERDVVV